ncbi:MAG: xanthine dehydrogenase accessory protein XdhC [Pseudomonadota bacterium]
MFNWPQRALQCIDNEIATVAVTVASLRGSAPREAGSKMLITADRLFGSVGGGYLEHECMRIARDLIATGERRHLRRFALGSQCGQCCGGAVQVLFTRLDHADSDWLRAVIARQQANLFSAVSTPLDATQPAVTWAPVDAPFVATLTDAASQRELRECVGPAPLHITIFGAGHVGKAIADVLRPMDAESIAVDNRQAQLQHDWPHNCAPLYVADPVSFVAHGRPQQHYLVMTHDHDLDYRLCCALMTRSDAAFVGLIGSHTKYRRFHKRWQRDGYSTDQINSITCPIGTPDIDGKHPGEIAIATVADILARRTRVAKSDTPELTVVVGADH